MEDYNGNMNFDYNFNQPNGEPHSDPNNQFYTISEDNKPIWAAVTSFVLSLLSLILCCCTCNYILGVAAIVLGIVSLTSKWRGKGFAIAGIIISALVMIYMVVSQIMFRDVSRDFADMIQKMPMYYEEYAETGEIPEEFYATWMKVYGEMFAASADAEKPIGDEDFYTPYEETEDSTGSTDSEDAEGEFGETPVEL